MRRDNKSGNVWIYPARHGFRVHFRDGSVNSKGRLKTNGSRVFDSFDEAEREAENLRRALATETRTVGMAIDAYEIDMGLRGLRPKSVQNVMVRLRSLMDSAADLPLRALDHRRCTTLYRDVASSGKFEPSTHHKALEMSKTWGAWCVHRDRGWIKVNPWQDVLSIGKAKDNRGNVLREDATVLWMKTAYGLAERGDLGAVAALIVLHCDLRPGEVVQIAAHDVDANGWVLHVAGDELKTFDSRRKIGLPARLRALLLALKEGKGDEELLFPRKAPWVAEQSKRISAAAGVRKINACGLRHTNASIQAREGRPVEEIGDNLGHADHGRTARTFYIERGALETAGAAKVAALLEAHEAPAAPEAPAPARKRAARSK